MSLLTVKDVAKRYGAVVALRSANLTVEAGEIHALMGANGAGKSTLVKILTGVIRPDSGVISLNNEAIQIGSPARARQLGIAAVFQDPSLIPDLTVAENMRLTGVAMEAVRDWLRTMDFDIIDPGTLVSELPLPTLRLLDLGRALAQDPHVLLLDEITAALPSDLAERVFRVMRQWRDRGRAVLFISHRLKEVKALCDKATVLRDGRDVGTLIPQVSGEAAIVDLMLGAAAEAQAGSGEGHAAIATSSGRSDLAPLLEVRGIEAGDEVRGISLQVRPGEIVGVAALEGQGQDALFDVLSGRRRRSGGEMLVHGRLLNPHTPYDAIRRGVVLVPADRVEGLLPQRSVRENIALPFYNRVLSWGPFAPGAERRVVGNAIRRLQIDTRAQRQVRRLSGGNQQKVTLARWVATGFEVLLLFDPTRGIDVGTKRQIHSLLRELAQDGIGVLMFTSELPEIQLACDRVVVLYEGRVVREMPAAEATEAALLRAAHGLTAEEATA